MPRELLLPTRITTREEADALLNLLLPKPPSITHAHHDPSTFAQASKHYSEGTRALTTLILWLSLRKYRPKIYARQRHHLAATFTSRLSNHLEYWSKVQHEAWKRERPPSHIPISNSSSS